MGGGKGGGSSSPKETELSKATSKMAQDFYNQTAPARGMVIDRGTSFLEGDLDPTQSPMYEPGKNALEGAYGTARENIISNMPTGGAMASNLAGLEQGRAGDLATLSGQIAGDEYNRIYGLATGAPGQAMQTMGGLSAGLSNQAAANASAQAQQSAGKSSMFGQLGHGAGYFLGGK